LSVAEWHRDQKPVSEKDGNLHKQERKYIQHGILSVAEGNTESGGRKRSAPYYSENICGIIWQHFKHSVMY
jgi:hypothetical protein